LGFEPVLQLLFGAIGRASHRIELSFPLLHEDYLWITFVFALPPRVIRRSGRGTSEAPEACEQSQ
jgi:hypothetical protein